MLMLLWIESKIIERLLNLVLIILIIKEKTQEEVKEVTKKKKFYIKINLKEFHLELLMVIILMRKKFFHSKIVKEKMSST